MKKTAILILSVAFVIAGFSQSLQISDNQGVIPNNSEIIQAGSPQVHEITTSLNVKNTSAGNINVLCRKTEILMMDSTEVTMCWGGACWPAKIHLSPEPTLINAGQTSTEFVGHYSEVNFHNFKPGVSVVRWTFFDRENPADSVTVVIKYTSYPLSIPETGIRNSMTDIYPNPASDRATVSYQPGTYDGEILVRNMIGKTVFQQKVTGGAGKMVINTTDLPDGIYFCSMLADGKVVKTMKLIIRH